MLLYYIQGIISNYRMTSFDMLGGIMYFGIIFIYNNDVIVHKGGIISIVFYS